MEAVNLPSVSRRTRKASGIIHFESKGLRTKGYLCENQKLDIPAQEERRAHPSSFLSCVGPPSPHGLDDARLHWALVMVNFTQSIESNAYLQKHSHRHTQKCFISYLDSLAQLTPEMNHHSYRIFQFINNFSLWKVINPKTILMKNGKTSLLNNVRTFLYTFGNDKS